MIKKSDYSFSLVLPCFNDKEHIEEAVTKSDEVLRQLFDRYEIILVNDGSTDGSDLIIARMGKKYPAVRLVSNIVNLGQGTSILIGFKAARYNLVMHNGIDLPFNLRHLSRVLPLLPKSDIVVVSRPHSLGYTRWRRFVSTVNRCLRFLFFHLPFPDLNFVQIYRKAALKKLIVRSRSPGFVTQELIIRAIKQGYKINQIQLPYLTRQKTLSHYGKLRDILWSFSDMIIFWLEQFYEKKSG